MRKLPALALACVILAGCAFAGSGNGTQSVAAVRSATSPLPTLTGTGLDGAKLSSDAFRGHVLVVNAWASWCLPCQQEQPALVDVSKRFASRGVEFLGLNHEDQPAAAQEWVRHYAVPYPSISDRAGRFAATLGYLGLPDTYVVDEEGTIRFVVTGPIDTTLLSSLIDRVLGDGYRSASSATAANSPPR